MYFCRLFSIWLDMVFILVLKLIMVMLLLLCYMCRLLFLNMVLFGVNCLFSSGFGKCWCWYIGSDECGSLVLCDGL